MRKYYLILFILLIPFQSVFSQDSLVVRGKIVAERNHPLKDVSVSVEGMKASPVLTDEKGEFTIKAPSGDAWLMIQPIGNYKNKRIFLNDRETLFISLADQKTQSGHDSYQSINRIKKSRDFVAASKRMDISQIRQRNIVTVDEAFQGMVPGMFTTHHSGMPGQGGVSFMRGINSMNATNAPLVIVDGMPLEKPGLFASEIEGNAYNPLSTIDPSDISSVTILKDALAASLYGTKASNGVVLIKTLQPKATETSINFSLQTGLNLSPDGYIPQLNDVQYKSLANEMLVSSQLQEEKFVEEYPGLFMSQGDDAYYRYMHNTNWQKLIFTNAMLTDAHIAVKGGSDIAKYGLSVGYHDQGGIFKNSSYNRFNVRFVSDLNVFSWFNMKVRANLTNNNSYLRESATSAQTSPITTSLAKPPILGPYQYDEEGNQLTLLDDVDELGTSNPLAVANNFMGENKNYRFIASIMGQADVAPTLKLKTRLGINFNTMKESIFMPNRGMEVYFDGESQNVSQQTNNHLFSFYTDNHLNFRKQFQSIHQLNTTLGFRIYTNSLQVDFGEAKNMPGNDQYTTLQSGQNDLRRMGGNNAMWNWLSLYHQLNYKFKDKYILNTGLSVDFSTLTGDQAETAFQIGGLPFGVFYSIGGGWRISEEDFLNQVPALDNLMLRASYGVTGNDDIGIYNALDYYKVAKYRETSGFIPGTIANRRLKYETTRQINLGVDLALWGDRTRLALDYFIKRNSDMFIYEPQESYLGYDHKPANAGEVRNQGWELSFFHRLVEGEKFDWDFSSNLTLLSNEVVHIKDEKLVTPFPGGEFVTMKGMPVNSYYGYQFQGVYATHEEAQEANLVNEKGIPYGAGDAIFKDVSGPDNEPDGIINNYDKMNLGCPIPDYFGSIMNTFHYKRWRLDVKVYFALGQEVFNYTRYMNERMVDLSNQSRNVLNRWQYEGDNTDVPRALWNDPVGNSDFSSRWIEDGSYIRLKNVRLQYTIPEEFLVFQNARFYLDVSNLITWNQYLGYDSEFSYSYNPMEQGIDYGLMPQHRQFMFGVQVGL